MFITRLRLKGYKRLLVSGINDFELNASSIYQIIIGTNGSGKSSILDELSPLPASPNQYAKGGLKEIHLTHRDHSYRLVSDFSSNSHYFYQDDVQLNDGKTITIQKTLVQRWFGFTTEIHELLIGVSTFTRMSPAKRREWFTLMSGGDLDVAISVYQKLQSRARDAKGVIKHLDTRTAVEQSKHLDAAILEQFAKNETTLHQTIQSLMLARTQSESPDVVSRKIRTALAQMGEVVNRVSLTHIPKPDILKSYRRLDMSIVDGLIAEQNTLYIRTESANQSNLEALAHLQDLVAALERSDANGLSELQSKADNLRSVIDTELGRLTPDMDVSVITSDTLESGRQCESALIAAIHDIPDNTDRQFTAESVQATRDALAKDCLTLDKLTAQLTQVSHRIQHAKAVDQTQCPQCGYHWQVGVKVDELANLESRSNTFQIHITQLQADIVKAREFLSDADTYRHALLRWRRMTESYPLLDTLWVAIAEAKLVSTFPKQIIPIYHAYMAQVEIVDSVITHRRALKELDALLEQTRDLGSLSTDMEFTQRLGHLEAQVEHHTQVLVTTRATLNALKVYRTAITTLQTTVDRISEMSTTLNSLLDEWVLASRDESYSAHIREFSVELAQITNELEQSRMAAAIVKDLNRDRIVVSQDLIAYQALATALSPVDGLIAELMGGFVESVVDRLNSVIAAVWTYDMVVEPCGLDSGSLDYKFPLVVKNSDLKVPDVSRASGSQVDIVDFAFKLLVMAYLDLSDSPIYLDELAPTLDEVHRINIIRYVRELLESQQVQQMFMISHYQESHSAFVNAEICVMDTANVLTIPNSYNHHVNIVRS